MDQYQAKQQCVFEYREQCLRYPCTYETECKARMADGRPNYAPRSLRRKFARILNKEAINGRKKDSRI